FVRGTRVDWAAVLPKGATEAHVDLPTYAFDHQHYWLPAPRPLTDATALGQGAADHPLLGAVVQLPQSDGLVFTSRLSLRTHPWLADHAIGGVVLVPGTGLVELAVRAGDEVGCGVLDELVVEAPLVVPEDGAVRVQVAVGGPDETGARGVEVYSTRQEVGAESGPDAWTRHATGTLTTSAVPTPDFDFTTWPPPGARQVDISDGYEKLTRAGYAYGPAFQCVRKVWRRGAELFADVVVPPEQRENAAGFGIHPALLDAALHTSILDAAAEVTDGTVAEDEPVVRLPFAWNGLTLHASGAASIRVRLLRPDPDTLSLEAADDTGGPVLTLDSLVSRAVSAEQLAAASGGSGAEGLFRVEWSALSSVSAG
ncbi:polyketide synthase dehydratase domain-containing protein, partial [Streptomyces sp. NPDC013455]|uniref:polyketide synthase dehydratase domain-containing protein n=1 Tax=Streptomyces sp. NPDC013455 TaxID=3155605 RepID=UPI0033FDDD92